MTTPTGGAKPADLVVILTEWIRVPRLDLQKVAKKMATPPRWPISGNIYSPRDARRAGFEAY